MSTPAAGTTAHALNAIVFLTLAATGFLLQWPTLRASITGGHSLTLVTVHRGAGLILPLVAGLLAVVVWNHRRSRRRRAAWVHLSAFGAATVLLLLSGLALWAGRAVPIEVLDQAQAIHVWATYAALAVLTLHLGQVVGRRLGAPAVETDRRRR